MYLTDLIIAHRKFIRKRCHFVYNFVFHSLLLLLLLLFTTVINAQGPVAAALFLGEPSLFNTTREDCIWKRGNDRDQCPDPDITMTLFPSKKNHAKSKVLVFKLSTPHNVSLLYRLSMSKYLCVNYFCTQQTLKPDRVLIFVEWLWIAHFRWFDRFLGRYHTTRLVTKQWLGSW